MTPLLYALAAGNVGFAIALVVAMLALRRAELALAARELADANARADGERNRADVAERQRAATEVARQEASDDADQAFADAIKTGGLVDPTGTWDRHAGGVPAAAAPAGAAADAGRVPARGPDVAARGAVAPAADVPAVAAGSQPLPRR